MAGSDSDRPWALALYGGAAPSWRLPPGGRRRRRRPAVRAPPSANASSRIASASSGLTSVRASSHWRMARAAPRFRP